ncbi:MAG: hypothetical protein RLY84_467, partial [Actinomycetota bacterium]
MEKGLTAVQSRILDVIRESMQER